MKTSCPGQSRSVPLKAMVCALAAAAANFQGTALGQGNLAPPGPPGPTMKTLSQVEPRTPISTVPYTISAPGAYYLTTNLTVSSGVYAITIAANDVALDLNGFSLISTDPTDGSIGVALGNLTVSVTNVTISNGVISGGVTNSSSGTFGGSGFGSGIEYISSGPANVRVTGVLVSGCRFGGIALAGSGSLVDNCTVSSVGAVGIQAATVSHSTAQICGLIGINATTVESSSASTVGVSTGITCQTANNCSGASAGGGTGLNANTATGCYGYSPTGYGITGQLAVGCYGETLTGSDAISVSCAENCYALSEGSGNGLLTTTAINSSGYSDTGTGISATTATGCYGSSTSSYGINAVSVNDSYGVGGTFGVAASVAMGCYGSSAAGDGIYVSGTATSCLGFSSSGTGIFAFIGNACHGISTSGTPASYTHNVNSY